MTTTTKKHVKKDKVFLESATAEQMNGSLSVIKRMLKLFEHNGSCHYARHEVAGIILESELALAITGKIVELFTAVSAPKEVSEVLTIGDLISSHISATIREELVAIKGILRQLHSPKKSVSNDALLSTIYNSGAIGTILLEGIPDCTAKVINICADINNRYTFDFTEDDVTGNFDSINIPHVFTRAFNFLTYGTPKEMRLIRDSKLTSIGPMFSAADDIISKPVPKSMAIAFVTDGYRVDVLYQSAEGKVWKSKMGGSKPVINPGPTRLFRVLKYKPKPVYKEYSLLDESYHEVVKTVPRISREKENAQELAADMGDVEATPLVIEDPKVVKERIDTKLQILLGKFSAA